MPRIPFLLDFYAEAMPMTLSFQPCKSEQSKASQAVLNKIQAMVEALLSETCLNREEINDLILMVNYA